MAHESVRKLSVENLQQMDRHDRRRQSTSTKESSDASAAAPAHMLGHPHRRMSRMIDPSALMGGGNRRMSMYRRASVATSLKTDQSGQFALPVKLANTYRLEPKDEEKFNASNVERVISGILESFLEGEEYSSKKCAHLAQNLTDVIKSRMKEMHYPRYKFVCNVIIGQNTNQGMQCVSRCIWNTKTDNFASVNFKSPTLFAVATVHGMYFE